MASRPRPSSDRRSTNIGIVSASPMAALREGVNASARNVILVAPTLGSHSEAEASSQARRLRCLLRAGAGGPARPTVRNRQASAAPLSAISFLLATAAAAGQCGSWPEAGDRALGPHSRVLGVTTAPTTAAMMLFGRDGRGLDQTPRFISTTLQDRRPRRLAESLRNMRVPNAIVQPSRDRRHNYVPITHWKERIQGAPFLIGREPR